MSDELALAGSGLTAVDLLVATEVTAAQELRVVRNLRARLGEVGTEVGRRYRASTFGVLGYALLASRTVHEAMNVALRFLDLSNTFAIPRAELDGPRVRIVVDGAGLPDDVRRFLVERDAAAIRAVLAELAGLSISASGSGDDACADLRRRRPRAPALALRPRCPGGLPRRCAETSSGGVVSAPGSPARCGSWSPSSSRGGAPMAAVAGRLGVSERTLRRRLAADGTSYQRLLDEVRASLAEELHRHRPALGRGGRGAARVRRGVELHRRAPALDGGDAGRASLSVPCCRHRDVVGCSPAAGRLEATS